MARKAKAPSQGRREFLTTLGAGAAGLVVGACGKCTTGKRSTGLASNAAETRAVLPAHIPMRLLKPEFEGEGPIPDGFLKYPQQEFARVITRKPGRGGPEIRTMSACWGPTPPSLGRNSFVAAINAELGVTINPSVQDGSNFGNKLSAILGARDVPDVLSTPSWEIGRIPRFTQAVKALFADLTEYLQGDKVKEYRMLAAMPPASWQHCVWGGLLAAVPYPTDGPFPWGMLYRKDLTDKLGIETPTTIEDLYKFGKAVTNPTKSVWAFGDTFEMIQMYFRCPGIEGGWRKKPGGGLEFKYELPEYREALRFTARLYKEGLVHPDLVASSGADAKQLFKSGRILMMRDGIGSWYGLQRDQSKIDPTCNVQMLPIFSAVGGEPLAWGASAPIFYTFIKRGLGRERTEEILRVLDWCAAPFGSKEFELNLHGVEGKHFTRAPDRSPIATDLGRQELADQFRIISGRTPVLVGNAEVPTYVPDLIAYTKATAKYLEEDPFEGIKIELPATYSRLGTSTEDKLRDVVRGRRPLSDLDQIVAEWRRAGGDEGRDFLEKVLADNGR